MQHLPRAVCWCCWEAVAASDAVTSHLAIGTLQPVLAVFPNPFIDGGDARRHAVSRTHREAADQALCAAIARETEIVKTGME